MIQTWWLWVVGALALVGGSGYLGYDYGQASKEAEHAEMQQITDKVLADLATRNWDLDHQLTVATQEAATRRTTTIVKWRDRAVALPARDCGWTEPERVLLSRGYCAAFPAAPNCLPAEVPAATQPARNNGGKQPAAVGVRHD